MGAACQTQFQNVPDTQGEFSQYERQKQRISISSIKQQHKEVRPNSKQFNIGMIDTKLQNWKSGIGYGSTVNAYAEPLTLNTENNVNPSPSKSQMGRTKIFGQKLPNTFNMKQIDMQQLHATQRPFQGAQTVILPKYQTVIPKAVTKNREELDFTFFHSLALPEYNYRPIPPAYAKQYQNLIVCQQEQRNGVKYIGQWKDMKTIHGNGVLQSNTTKYIGQFRNGLKHLHGRQIQKNQVYEGEFENGRRKGIGTKYTPESMEEGIFDNYLQKGIIRYVNGNIYEGELMNNMYHGYGTYYDAASKTTHKGIFRNGKLNGQGQILLNGKQIYNGQFYEGLKHGQGTFNWSEKDYYNGGYSKGKKHGFGELIRGNTMYRGQFVNGNMHGNMQIYDLSSGRQILRNTAYYENGVLVRGDEESQILSQRDGMPKEWRDVTQRRNQDLDYDKELEQQYSSFAQIGKAQPIQPILIPPSQPIIEPPPYIQPEQRQLSSKSSIQSPKVLPLQEIIPEQPPMVIIPPSQPVVQPVVLPPPSISNIQPSSQISSASRLTTRNNLYRPIDNNYEGQLQNSVESAQFNSKDQPHYGDANNPHPPSKIGNIAGSKILFSNLPNNPNPQFRSQVHYTTPEGNTFQPTNSFILGNSQIEPYTTINKNQKESKIL